MHACIQHTVCLYNVHKSTRKRAHWAKHTLPINPFKDSRVLVKIKICRHVLSFGFDLIGYIVYLNFTIHYEAFHASLYQFTDIDP